MQVAMVSRSFFPDIFGSDRSPWGPRKIPVTVGYLDKTTILLLHYAIITYYEVYTDLSYKIHQECCNDGRHISIFFFILRGSFPKHFSNRIQSIIIQCFSQNYSRQNDIIFQNINTPLYLNEFMLARWTILCLTLLIELIISAKIETKQQHEDQNTYNIINLTSDMFAQTGDSYAVFSNKKKQWR